MPDFVSFYIKNYVGEESLMVGCVLAFWGGLTRAKARVRPEFDFCTLKDHRGTQSQVIGFFLNGRSALALRTLLDRPGFLSRCQPSLRQLDIYIRSIHGRKKEFDQVKSLIGRAAAQGKCRVFNSYRVIE